MKENIKGLTGLSFYEAVEKLSEDLYQKYGDLRDPACDTEVLSIARGGLIPATYVVYKLGCPINILYLRSYPKPDVQKEVEAYGILPFRSKKLPKRILIVDDIQDTGKSFAFVKKFFEDSFGAENMKNVDMVYCTVLYRKRDDYDCPAPDMYGCMTNKKDWVIFPYDHQLD